MCNDLPGVIIIFAPEDIAICVGWTNNLPLAYSVYRTVKQCTEAYWIHGKMHSFVNFVETFTNAISSYAYMFITVKQHNFVDFYVIFYF